MRVIIAGGGVGGLTAALRAKRPACVIEDLGDAAGEYGLHPALLDACFQSLGGGPL